MPYKSDVQRKFLNVNRAAMMKQGVNVDEWNKASKGIQLPERAKRKSILKSKK